VRCVAPNVELLNAVEEHERQGAAGPFMQVALKLLSPVLVEESDSDLRACGLLFGVDPYGLREPVSAECN